MAELLSSSGVGAIAQTTLVSPVLHLAALLGLALGCALGYAAEQVKRTHREPSSNLPGTLADASLWNIRSRRASAPHTLASSSAVRWATC